MSFRRFQTSTGKTRKLREGDDEKSPRSRTMENRVRNMHREFALKRDTEDSMKLESALKRVDYNTDWLDEHVTLTSAISSHILDRIRLEDVECNENTQIR